MPERKRKAARRKAAPRSKKTGNGRAKGDGQDPGRERSSGPHGLWSGTIAFGLVSVPVDLYPANRARGVSLRMVDDTGTPLKRRYYCSREDEPVERDEIVRGYEVESDRYVVVTDEELEALAPKKSREIDLRRFVEASALDPFYFERAYYLAPARGSSKAYRLLAATMEASGRAGIATFVMRDKEYLVAILARDGVMRAETLRFPDELRAPKDMGLPAFKKPSSARVRTMEKQIEAHKAAKLKSDELADEYGERLRAIVERKRKAGKDVVEAPEGVAEEEGAQIIDLMAVLRRSLGEAKPPRRAPRAGARPRKKARTK